MRLILITLLGLVTGHCDSYKAEHYDCDVCTEDFVGFGTPASKCGCCPWPCCCKCFEVIKKTVSPCTSLLDLAFILDSGGSISKEDWEGPTKTFVRNIVGIFNNIGQDVKVAMVTYSTNATLNWNLGDPETSSAAALQQAITDLPHLGKFRNTVEGMEVAAEQVFGGKDDRPEVINVAILLTDGTANFRVTELPAMAKRLQADALVAAIGVTGKVDRDELLTIASRPELVFSVDDMDGLWTMLTHVQICPETVVKEECFCCCTPEQFFGGGGAYYYYRH